MNINRSLCLFCIFCLLNCAGQIKRENSSVDEKEAKSITEDDEWGVLSKFDSTLTADSSYMIYKHKGWLVEIYETASKFSSEYAPSNYFYKVHKQYHPNGVISERTKSMFDVMIDSIEIFNENGGLIRKIYSVSETALFSREDVLLLLEKEGWFNRREGKINMISIARDASGKPYYVDEGVKKMDTDGSFYKEVSGFIRMRFEPNLSFVKRPTYWYIMIYSYDGKRFKGDKRNEPFYNELFYYVTMYIINGDTGEYTKEIQQKNVFLD